MFDFKLRILSRNVDKVIVNRSSVLQKKTLFWKKSSIFYLKAGSSFPNSLSAISLRDAEIPIEELIISHISSNAEKTNSEMAIRRSLTLPSTF